MRLLNILPSLDQDHGGPVRLVLDLSAAALPLGLDSEVLGVGPLRVHDNPLPLERIHSVRAAGPPSFAYSPEIANWLADRVNSYDAVLIHGAWTHAAWTAAKACVRQDISYGVFPHGMLEPWAVTGQGLEKAIKKRLYWIGRERHIYRKATAVFFTTKREQVLSNSIFRFPPRQNLLAVYGIEPSVPDPGMPTRADLTEYKDQEYVLFLGRIHPKKNIDFLLKAWALARVPRECRLVIAGPGDVGYLSTLKELTHRLNLSDVVDFVGFVSGADKSFLLRNASWFALPSKQENFGIAVLEALSHGCPVVISTGVYVSEAFREDSEVLPLNLDDWAEFLRLRMRDPVWRNLTIEDDLKQLRNQFDMKAIVEQWATTLTQTLRLSRQS